MTQVNMGDEVIETDLPADAVEDLQKPAETAEPAKVEEAPEQPVKPDEAPSEEPVKPEAPKAPERDPEGKPQKPKPIASLLEKKHELETQLEAARKTQAELEAKVAELSKAPVTPQNIEDVKQLAETYGLDEQVLTDIINVARKGVSPELPKEVQDLLAERQREKQEKEEETRFNADFDSLVRTFDSEPLKDQSVKDKVMALAYSTELAPDGVPYFQKPLHELYFKFVKPEIEPGKPSAEASRGGSQATKVMDFEEIHNDDAKLKEFAETASSEQWQAYAKWRDAKQGDTPIIRRTN